MNQMSKKKKSRQDEDRIDEQLDPERGRRFRWEKGDFRVLGADEVKKAASVLGAKGGAAGRGASKARTSEQARAAANARWAKHRKEREERENG